MNTASIAEGTSVPLRLTPISYECIFFDMDLHHPQFLTHELLAISPGLPLERLKQWIAREQVKLSSHGRTVSGRRTMHSAADAIQIVMVRKLTDQGITAGTAHAIWRDIRNRLDDWRGGAPETTKIAAIHFDANNSLVRTSVTESALSISALEKGIKKYSPEADADDYDIQIVIRLDRIIAGTIKRLQTIIDTRDDFMPDPNWKPGRKTRATD